MEITPRPHLHSTWIDHDAKEIVAKLQSSGYKTYLVGGCVRDLLVGHHPKDYDIATDAIPQQVKRKISFSFIIGKRFRLVLVKRGSKQFEIATFRRNITAEDIPEGEEAPFGDNIFGTPEEDALRRDFTINALFYDPINDELIDYSNGLKDIDDQILRIIGDPDERLKEDPIRIFRAIRLSHKLNFVIEPSLRQSIADNAQEVLRSVLPRRREELLKILRLPEPARALLEMYDLGVLQYVLPSLKSVFSDEERKMRFLHYLSQLSSFVEDMQSPSELFGHFLLSFIRAHDENPFDVSQFLDSEDLQKMLRDELGMFKTEQIDAWKWLTLQKNFSQTDYYKRKGERRQLAFVANEHVKHALKIAKSDFTIPAQDLLFWQTQLSKLS